MVHAVYFLKKIFYVFNTELQIHPKCLIRIFNFAFFTNFCQIKIDLSGNTVYRFISNVVWDFFCEFQTLLTFVQR